MNLMNLGPVRILGPIRTGHVYVTMAEIGTTSAQVTRPVMVPRYGAAPLTGPGAAHRPVGARATVRQAVARPTRHMPRGAASLDCRRMELPRQAGHRKGDVLAGELIRLPQLAAQRAEFGGRAARSSGTYRARLAHAQGRRRALPGHGRAVEVRASMPHSRSEHRPRRRVRTDRAAPAEHRRVCPFRPEVDRRTRPSRPLPAQVTSRRCEKRPRLRSVDGFRPSAP